MFPRKRGGADPVRLTTGLLVIYIAYQYWRETAENLRHRDKIADQDRKIAAYRLSRDDELKSAVILETRLATCTEQNNYLNQEYSDIQLLNQERDIETLERVLEA